jgi:hypothetical protein
MQRIRALVKGNRLTSRALSEAHHLQAIERDGRGWVIDVDGQVLGFAIANSVTGNIWTLFVDPEHEVRIMAVAYTMRWSMAVVAGSAPTLAHNGGSDSRQRFYESAGWCFADKVDNGELRYGLTRIHQEG